MKSAIISEEANGNIECLLVYTCILYREINEFDLKLIVERQSENEYQDLQTILDRKFNPQKHKRESAILNLKNLKVLDVDLNAIVSILFSDFILLYIELRRSLSIKDIWLVLLMEI